MACQKIRYKSKLDAMIGLAKLDRKAIKHRHHRKASTTEEIRVYKCEKCNGWHLTSRPDRFENESREIFA